MAFLPPLTPESSLATSALPTATSFCRRGLPLPAAAAAAASRRPWGGPQHGGVGASPSSVPNRCPLLRTPTAVFTGIVEEVGTVVSLTNEDIATSGGGCILVVRATTAAEGVALGDSVAVNGVCLTVTTMEPVDGVPASFSDDAESSVSAGASVSGRQRVDLTFGLAAETLRCTSLGDLSAGDGVNLERSLAADGRFGGHVVQGHVDATGTITSVTPDADSLTYVIAMERRLMKYIVRKGYVAVDGTSLTIVNVSDDGFSFMMIPYTQEHVALAAKRAGERVNVEVDITGKYIEKIVAERLAESKATKV
ncbi:hypothetical protein MMPV_009188 [Pyropia vietnamensis]